MKVIVVILLATILQAKAVGVFAQKITINEKNVSLKVIIKKLHSLSGYDFIYNDDLINNEKGITLNVKDASVEDILKQVLNDRPLTFNFNNKFVVIQPKIDDDLKDIADSKPVLADSVLIGKVTDYLTKKAIAGATVKISGKSSTVITDASGTFRIMASRGQTLSISYIGYKPRSIVINSFRALNITLEEVVSEMKDVVINGIFERKKATATGTQTTVTREELLRGGTINVIQSLRNIDPAFNITENRLVGSDPNALPNINIGGQSGLPDLNGDYASNPNLPLFILDGFETTLQRIIDLDMYRIQSVTLLKDAASKSIYGSKAANGVVVVETIRPLPGELRVAYNTSMGYSMPDLSSYSLTNARQKLEAELLAGVYDGGNNINSQYTLLQDYNQYLAGVVSGVETDWMAKPLRNGLTQTHSINVSGGDNRFTYGLTGSYNNVNGVMKGSSSNVFTGNLNLAYRVGAFNIRNDLTLLNRKGNNSPWGNFSDYVSMNPYLSYYDINGKIAQIGDIMLQRNIDPDFGGSLANTNIYNPAFNATLNTFDRTKATSYTNNTSLDWRITQQFRMVARFSFSKQLNENDKYLPAGHNSFVGGTAVPLNRRGSYTKGNGEQSNYDGQLNLSYSKLIGKSSLTVNGGTTISENEGYNVGFITEGFPNDKLNFPSLGLQYALNSRPTGSESLVRDMAVFASTNYSFNQKYNVDLTYRASQSSQYGANNRWGHFWSAGLSWNLHEEKFLKDIGFIDQLRPRVSTGFTGQQNFNTFLGIGSYTYDRALTYSSSNGAYLLALANPDLKWQRRQDHSIGLDYGFMKKFNGYFNYRVSYTNGLLTDITLPTSTGFSSYKANLGKVKNDAIEANLSYMAYSNAAKRESLSFMVSIAQNRNKLLEISNSLQSYNKRQNDLSNSTNVTSYEARAAISRPKILFEEGQSMNAIYAVRSLGIDPATGKERYLKADGTTTYDWNINDQVVVGDELPDWQGLFGFNMAYAGFRATATFRFQMGGQLYNETLINRVENANIYNNVDIRVLTDRWQKPGDHAFFKDIKDRTVTRPSSRFVENNNNVTLGSCSIGYDFDRFNAVKRLGFSQLRASITSSELFTVSTMRIERGTTYPFARTMQLTLNANF